MNLEKFTQRARDTLAKAQNIALSNENQQFCTCWSEMLFSPLEFHMF